MRWTWNAAKDRLNRAKHGLPLSLGEVALDDSLAVHVPDSHPDGNRWVSVCSVGQRVVVVVHTWPDDDEETGRIISVRLATSRERRSYEDGR